MDSKRPDVRVDDTPEEEGIVTKRDRGDDEPVTIRRTVRKLREALKR